MPIETSDPVTIPEETIPAFESVGYGITHLMLDTSRTTSVTSGMARLTPVSADAWLQDAAHDKIVSIRDLQAEVVALNDAEAISMLQAVIGGLLGLCQKLAIAKGVITAPE